MIQILDLCHFRSVGNFMSFNFLKYNSIWARCVCLVKEVQFNFLMFSVLYDCNIRNSSPRD